MRSRLHSALQGSLSRLRQRFPLSSHPPHSYSTAVWRRLGLGIATFSTAYWMDSELNAQTFQRNIRTLWNGLCITLDYKLFFHPGADVNTIHQRVAERILYTCQKNAGLYVKFGQSVASMNHILPPQYNETLKSLFADAPIMEFDQVLRIFQEEFKCHPDDLFIEFERAPVASASIAQVHRAKLKDGTPVAVKVQKHYIRRQLFWDMLAFRFIIKAFEYFFELPLSWSADYTERHLREEIDFRLEADNADRAKRDFAGHSQLSKVIYIPQVYREFSTERIMTTEWIEGISLTDRDRLRLEGYPITSIMRDMISAFSFQIFHSGFVHADPHPGNIIVRKSVTNSNDGSYQICLIDHGLYVCESDSFRHLYCLFWKSLFLMDFKQMERICHDWGIQDMNIFASATLQRPFNPRKAIHIASGERVSVEDLYRLQVHNKERIKKFLSDTEKIPLELIFVGRTLNLVRSNNKYFGSPVNRINLMAEWAVQGLGSDWSYWAPNTVRETVRWMGPLRVIRDNVYPRLNYWWFRFNLFWISVGFHFNRTVQRIGEWITGRRMAGFEDVMDQQMIKAIRGIGIIVNHDTFEA